MTNRIKTVNSTNVIFLIISIIICVLQYAVFRVDRFVAAGVYDSHGNPDTFYTRDLMSLGSDDNGIMFTMMLFRIIFIFITLLNLKKRCLKFFIIPFLFDILCLCLISDTTSIGRTIVDNGVFLAWFLIWIISFAGCIFVMYRQCTR